MRRRRILVAIATLLAFHGCAGPAAVPTSPTGSRKREVAPTVVASASASASASPAAVVALEPALPTIAPSAGAMSTPSAFPTPLVSVAPIVGLTGVVSVPAGILSNHGGGVLSNNGGNLTSTWGGALMTGGNNGTLISDHGAGVLAGYGIVSNNGGAIVGNNSGGYTLFQVGPAPAAPVLLEGALVRLLDAAGQPILGTDGKPLEARTDAQGRYRIDAPLPPRNLLAVVALPNAAGALLAIAPRDAGASRRADLDLVSTLATGYVLGQYVTTQADPLTTLEKLPGAIEVATRLEAGRAAASVTTPLSLEPSTVTRTVADLRRRDPGLDAQLEIVRKLLVAAGQADLGAGKPAREVALAGLTQLLFGLDGAVYLSGGLTRRVWRLRPNGILENAAGAGSGNPAEVIDGVDAPKAGLGELGGVSVDRQGRLLLLEMPWKGSYARLSRLGPDGKLKELFRSTEKVHAAFEAPDGAIWILQNAADLNSVKLLELVPGSAPKLIHSFTGDEAMATSTARNSARDDQGRLYFQTYFIAFKGPSYSFDPASKALTKLATAYIDQFGAQYTYSHDGTAGQAAVTPTDGRTPFTIGPWLPEMRFSGGAVAPDGQAWVYSDDAVWRRDGSTWTHMAGRAGVPGGAAGGGEFAATDLPLKSPESMAANADALYVVDNATERKLYRVQNGKGVLFAGGQAVPLGTEVKGQGDGGPAVDAGFMGITHVDVDAAGSVYVAENYFLTAGVRKIGTDGAIKTHGTLPGQIIDMAVAADGRAMVITAKRELWEIPAAGGAAVQVTGLSLVPDAVDIAPDGTAWLKSGTSLYRREGTIWKLKKTDPKIPNGIFQSIAADAQGRVYLGQTSPPLVSRWDPLTDQVTAIAGTDAPLLNGFGVDESLAYVADIALAPNGDLLIADKTHQQVKRLPIRE